MCGRLGVLVVVTFVVALSSTSVVSGADPSLVGWWRFDEGSGTVARDSSGYGNDATLMGNATWAAGNFQGAVQLDGDGDYVQAAASESLNVTGEEITLTAWVYFEDVSIVQIILAKAFNNTSHLSPYFSYGLHILSNGRGRCWLSLTSNTQSYAMAPTGTVTAQRWHHMAGVYDGSEIRLYLDGAVVATAAATGQINPYPNGLLRFGDNGGLTEPMGGKLDDIRIYSRALSDGELHDVLLGRGPAAEVAGDPVPANAVVDVPRDTALSWTPGHFAAAHDVYLGTVFEDVDGASRANPLGVLVSEGQTATTYEPAAVLGFSQTYYWRVDEVNAAPDNTIFKGEIWSFTVEPVGYPITGVIVTTNGVPQPGADPANVVNGAGLNENDEHSIAADDMWLGAPGGAEPLYLAFEFDGLYKLHEMLVWNYNSQFEPVVGFGMKDVTIEYSADGVDWAVLGDVELARAPGIPTYAANTVVDFAGAVAKYIRLTVNSGWGILGQYGFSEVRFLYTPVLPREPQPADGEEGVNPNTLLSWRAGREAVSHDVSLATAPDAVTLVDSVSDDSYDPGALDLGTTYYWKIDEINEAAAPVMWEGDLWSFSTLEYFVIDDFESYNDDDNTIFDTWLDGFVNETGSTVGYFEAPFAEQTIVHGGRQSMPLEYVNDTAPFYSEAEFDLGNIDLDTNGADTLRLFVAGQAPAFVETADGTILMNGIGVDIWNTADEFRYVYKTLNGDGSMIVRVDSLADSDVWAKGGVMIRETTDAGSAFAAVYITGNNGVRYQARLTTDASAVSDSSVATAEQIALREPAWVKIERVGNAFNGYYSTDGEDWTDMAWNPQTINMAAGVTIGLALTSHNATVATGAAFAGVAESGGVSGNWQVAEVGVAQPTTGNDIAPLYVALEDTSGKVAVVTHPNPAAVGVGAWQEWLIPYSDLAGINLNRIAVMYIGVGDRDNPTTGGTGLIFIDDIGFGRPAAIE